MLLWDTVIGKEQIITRRRALTLLGTTFGSLALVSCGAQPTPVPRPTPTEVPPPTPVPPAPTGIPLPSTEAPVPAATASATATVPPIEVPSAVPTKSSGPAEANDALKPERPKAPEQKEGRLFNILLEPFIREAEVRRTKRAKEDPEYSRRVDAELNTGRVNFLIFGYGETYEPPAITEPGTIIGSPSLISINYLTGEMQIISLTHDIRAPEVEKALGTLGKRLPGSAKKIDQAYLDSKVGNLELMRLTLENATGLAIDFQFAFSDIAIQKLIDNVFQGIEVDVPVEMELAPYYYQGTLHDEKKRRFSKGKVKLNGQEVVGYIKAIPTVNPGEKITDGRPPYSPPMEHNKRKMNVIEGLMSTTRARFSPGLLKTINDYFDGEAKTKEMEFDFNYRELLGKGLLNAIGEWAKSSLPGGKSLDASLPEITGERYLVDRCCSTDPENTPVHWHYWSPQVPGEEKLGEDYLSKKVYDQSREMAYEVPYGGNPYGDLIDDYWFGVRTYIKKFLLKQ